MRRILALAFVVSLAACSDRNAFSFYDVGYPSSSSSNDVGTPDVDNTGVEYADRYTTRLTSLRFLGPPAADLNGIVAINMDLSMMQPIIILHEFSDIDAEAGTATLSSTNALKTMVPGVFRYDPDYVTASADGTLNPESGQFSGTFPRFHFAATIEFNEDVQTISIPLTDLTISGVVQLSSEGDTATILAGQWLGHITKIDGDRTMVTLTGASAPRPLTDLFLEDTLNFDTATGMQTAAGTGNGWLIHGEFEAEPTTLGN